MIIFHSDISYKVTVSHATFKTHTRDHMVVEFPTTYAISAYHL